MDKTPLDEFICSIKKSKAEYPSVLMHKSRWLEIIAEIELLQLENKELMQRPVFDTGSVLGREKMVIAGLNGKGLHLKI